MLRMGDFDDKKKILDQLPDLRLPVADHITLWQSYSKLSVLLNIEHYFDILK